MSILVVGTGRCGTTTVTRILHENLGYNMGEHFCMDRNNDFHCFEEDVLYNTDMGLVNGTLSFPMWQKFVSSKVTANYERYGEDWGFKSPSLCYTLPVWLPYFNTMPLIIFVQRDTDLVVKSFMRCYGWGEGQAVNEVNNRIKHMNIFGVFIAHANIRFTAERRSDEDVEKELKEILKKKF